MKRGELHRLHLLSSGHRAILEGAREIYCFDGEHVVSFREIKDWIDDGETALCPSCGTDCLVPSCLSEDQIKEMHDYWMSTHEENEASGRWPE